MSKGGVEFLSRTSLIPPALCIPAADERRAWRQAQFGGWRDELSAKTSKGFFSCPSSLCCMVLQSARLRLLHTSRQVRQCQCLELELNSEHILCGKHLALIVRFDNQSSSPTSHNMADTQTFAVTDVSSHLLTLYVVYI